MVRHNLKPHYERDPFFPEMIPCFTTKIKPSERYKVNCSQDLAQFARKTIPESRIEHVEHFTIIFLDRSMKLIAWSTVSIGGINSTLVDSRVVFQHALLCCASSIVLCHNHPSGSYKPSDCDISITKRMRECGKIMEIEVLDHIILGEKETYFSFADDGMM